MKLNRRTFVATSVGSAAVAGANHRAVGANDRIRVGFIGIGGMGRYNLTSFQQMPEVDIVAACDVWEHNRNRAVELTSGQATPFRDFREVLDRQDIDVVVVSTPDHWHAPILIAACDAGKDVYVEKPPPHVAGGKKNGGSGAA